MMGVSVATGSWTVGAKSNSAQSDQELVAKRFEAEAMPHLGAIARGASRLLQDPAKAEDIVQEVFLEAWKSFHRFEPGTNCRAWLYQILFYKVQHHRRKWFRSRLFGDPGEILETQVAGTPPVAQQLTDEDMLAALDRVPADFRAVILLIDIEEFSYKEAAAVLGIPIGTVMSRLSRARALLRGYLAGFAQSYGFGKAKQKGQSL